MRSVWYHFIQFSLEKPLILESPNMKPYLILICVALFLPSPLRAADSGASPIPDQEAVVSGNNAFAVELYRQLKNPSGNLFFSPASISTALAMAYAGARGETAEEMARTLHFTLPPEQLHPTMGALLKDLNDTHDGYQLHVANALWGQQGYTFLDDFLKLTKDDYGAGFYQMDFKGDMEGSRRQINQWVEQRTESRIRELLQPGALTQRTRLLLTNAIYFKGDWNTAFELNNTMDDDFHVSGAQTVTVKMMYHKGNYRFFNGETFMALEVPYKGRELSMIVFLPNQIDGLPALEDSFTPKMVQQWLTQLRSVTDVQLSMPKFKMESQFGLGNTLAAMGMRQAFEPLQADFSGMASREEMKRQDGREANLFISAVIHKAFVDVNEKGTEAAAATAIVIPPSPQQTIAWPPPIVFRADHPFLFLIRDNKSGSILFMGRVADPTN
jgi:serpin B